MSKTVATEGPATTLTTHTDLMPAFKVAPVKHNHAAHLAYRSENGGRAFCSDCPECQLERAAKHGANPLPYRPQNRRFIVGCPACAGENR